MHALSYAGIYIVCKLVPSCAGMPPRTFISSQAGARVAVELLVAHGAVLTRCAVTLVNFRRAVVASPAADTGTLPAAGGRHAARRTVVARTAAAACTAQTKRLRAMIAVKTVDQ